MHRRIRISIRYIRDHLDNIAEIREHLDVIEKELGPEEEPTDDMGPIPGVPDDPEEMINTTWPTADEPAKDTVYMKDLRELTELKGLTIIGEIKTTFDVKSYVKSEGGAGLIYRFVLSDPTGDITVIAFDDMATKLKQYTIGQILKITNAWKMEVNKSNVIELHVGNFAKIEVVE